jgi:bacillithiol biosynthesis cysteine-adding enzyme BshC
MAAVDRGPLWESVVSSARRLGAPRAAIEAADALRSGAVAVVTGQQPGLLGGPVFTLYKAATAVALARELATLLGEPVVPVFWAATDDSDFAEVAGATVAASDLALDEVALDPALSERDLMVGHLPASAGQPARLALTSGRGAGRASELAGPIWERGGDWGEGFAACLYQLLGSYGLVLVDAREPALRELARPLIGRYLEDPRGFAAAVGEGGEALEGAGLGRQLGAFAASHPLFHEVPPRRRRLAAGGEGDQSFVRAARAILAGEEEGRLWPGVALRPLVIDRVLPSVARVLGPAEVTYMAQLAPAYRRLGVAQPPAVPRLTATLVPPAAVEVAAAAGAGLGAFLADPSATLRRYYEQELPPAAEEALARLENGQRAGFAAAREALAELGRGLDELVDSVARKVDFQLRRLRETAVKREKSRRESADPRLRHLSSFLRPDQGLQERRLALLAALALGGDELVATVLERAESDLQAIRDGRSYHHLIGIEP